MNKDDEPQLSPFEELVIQVESGNQPIDKYLGRSLRELYIAGSYRIAVLRGTSDPSENMIINTLRIVGLRENRLDSSVVSFLPDNQGVRQQLDTMLEETRRIPVDFSDFTLLGDAGLAALKKARLQTVAAMQVSRSLATGIEIVQVHYPRVFMNLLPVPTVYQQDLGLGMASYFLKVVPFGEGGVDITIPSH